MRSSAERTRSNRRAIIERTTNLAVNAILIAAVWIDSYRGDAVKRVVVVRSKSAGNGNVLGEESAILSYMNAADTL